MIARTVKDAVSVEGIGLHSGQISKILIHPSDTLDINFYSKGVVIPANVDYVCNTLLSTDLCKDGVVIKTVEHIMAVFHLLGIKGVTVELIEGFEIPIGDGSGAEFYDILKDNLVDTGEEIEVLDISRYMRVGEEDFYIEAHPSTFTEVIYKGFVNYIDCGTEYTYRWGNPEEIIYARTFCYLEDVENLLKNGYGKGGSPENVLIIDKEGVYNKEGLRYKEEPLRHKIFDLLGDLYLSGMHIRGKIVSHRGGHTLNVHFVREIMKELTAAKIQ